METPAPIPSQWRNVGNVALEILSDMPGTMARSRASLRFIIATASAEAERQAQPSPADALASEALAALSALMEYVPRFFAAAPSDSGRTRALTMARDVLDKAKR